MSIINGATKKGQQLLARASRWDGTDLSDVYGRCSIYKERAMRYCRERCAEDDGFNFHICSHNTCRFSVAWEYINKETGELMTRIETAANTYIVDGSRRKEVN